MLSDFRAFISKGNVVDLAVGVIIGAAFGKITTSLVGDIIMPPLGLIIGKVDFANRFVALDGKSYATLAEAKAAAAPTVNYGAFINVIVEFLIVAIAVYMLVQLVNRLQKRKEPTATTKPCPVCTSTIPLLAARCPLCTSDLGVAKT